MRKYEIRDPVYGFIDIDEWERDIINQPAFQRLRRIKQLAWTDMVYPGATHSRFEHSLGVMHVATRLFDAIVNRSHDLLRDELKYDEGGLKRQRRLIRLAALLHDLGHAPFSHAAEEILPFDPRTRRRFVHEQYSAAIAEHALADVIEGHQVNKRNYGLRVADLSDFFLEAPSSGGLVWRDLVSSQMDADRMDYMLRDSYHAGVSYGHYDLDRVVATVALVERPDGDGFAVGVDEDGIHAVEGLILARYMLFTQVYFHKTRVIFDYHLIEALKSILAPHGGCLPPPDSPEGVRAYLDWDDWRVLGALADGQAGNHGRRLKERDHFRQLCSTREVPTLADLNEFEDLHQHLVVQGIDAVRRDAEKSWYKFEKPGDEILVRRSIGLNRGRAERLSQCSPVVSKLQAVKQSRLYVPEEKRQRAEGQIQQFKEAG